MQVIEGATGRTVDVEIHVDATTFIDVGVGRLRGRDAIRRGKLRLVGSEAARRRYSSIIRPLAGAGAVSVRSGRRRAYWPHSLRMIAPWGLKSRSAENTHYRPLAAAGTEVLWTRISKP